MEKLTLVTSPYCTLSNDQIKEVFESRINEAYTFDVKPCEAMTGITIESKFGGQPYCEGEPWPSCSRCKTPLRFIFQFNNTNLASSKKIDANCLFVFFACMEQFFDGGCAEDHDYEGTWVVRRYISPFMEKAQEVISPEDIDPDYFNINPCTINVSYIKALPELEQLDSASISILELMADKSIETDWYELSLLYKQIAQELLKCQIDETGGWQYLGLPCALAEDIPRCDRCSSPMDLLFQIGFIEGENANFGYSRWFLYLFYCQNHLEIIKLCP